jgi:hypothetical protein
MDKEFRDYSYNSLDNDHAVAYHPKAMGVILEDWMNFIVDYCKERGRDFFFATNEFQRPTVYFDATNVEEWNKNQKLHGRDQVKFWKDQGWKRIKPKNKIDRFVKLDDDKKQSTKK